VSKEIEIYIRHMKKEGRPLEGKDPLFQPSHNHQTGVLKKAISRMTVLTLIKKYCLKAEVFDRVSPHSARATVISSLLEKGVDLYKVSLAVGHSDPSTTKKYDKRGKRIEDNVVLEIGYFDQDGD